MKTASFLAVPFLLLMLVGLAFDAQAEDSNAYLMPIETDFTSGPQEYGEAEDFSAMKSAGGAFGTHTQDYWIAATEFSPIKNGCSMDLGSTTYGFTIEGTCTNDWTFAQVNLPAGARVTIIACYAYDADAVENVWWNFDRVEYTYSTGPLSFTNVATQSKDYSGGWTEIFTGLDETIRYRDGALRQLYSMNVNLDVGNADIQLLGCRLWWNRTVSPAPGAATFGDVPTNHWAFQFVEALAASGITGGCGGGNFCPDDPLNRGQMAVFLSAALGLHYPY